MNRPTPAAHIPGPGNARLGMRAVVVAVVVCLMFVVPAMPFSGKRPSPWGWQMYSGRADTPTIVVTTSNGHTEPLAFGDLVGWPRPEPDYLEPLARFICSKDSSAKSIKLTRVYPPADEEFECSSF